MSALRTVPQSLAGLLHSLWKLASYAFLFVSVFVAPRAKAAAIIVALSSQLAACRQRVEQKKEARPRFRPAFRALWVVFSRFLEGIASRKSAQPSRALGRIRMSSASSARCEGNCSTTSSC